MSKEIKHEYTDNIICPWCGYEDRDSWEFSPNNEDMALVECNSCDKKFYATRIITITYFTEKAKYGTCGKCGKKEVVIASGNHYMKYPYEDYCQKCEMLHEAKSIQKFLGSMEGK